jgi:hypothetical protein
MELHEVVDSPWKSVKVPWIFGSARILNTPDICRKMLMANGSRWNYMKRWIVLGSRGRFPGCFGSARR